MLFLRKTQKFLSVEIKKDSGIPLLFNFRVQNELLNIFSDNFLADTGCETINFLKHQQVNPKTFEQSGYSFVRPANGHLLS